MANLHLVTGYAGEEHITSNDQGSFNAAIMGTGEFVLERGKQFAAQVISNNKVRVFDGDLLMQGRHIRLKENTYVDLFFENGTQGYKRTDQIAVRYEKDPVTDIESANLVVIKGVPTEDAYVSSEKITGDILNEHALQNDTVLYKVNFDGLGIQEPVKVFSTVPTLEATKKDTIEQIKQEAEKAIQDVAYAAGELVPLFGNEAPTAETKGKLKQFFVNIENRELFICTEEGDTNSWLKIGGGIGGVPLSDCKTLALEENSDNLTLKWEDPDDVVFNGGMIAEWAGTKVVRKEGSNPESVEDGILIADSTVRNQYAVEGLQDTDVVADTQYNYALFPYTMKNVYTMSDTNRVSGSLLGLIYDPVLANNTWEQISAVSKAGIASRIWNIGDTKDNQAIIGFDHDDLADGSGKAGITFINIATLGTALRTAWHSNAGTEKVLYKNSTLNVFCDKQYETYADSEPYKYIRKVLKKCAIDKGSEEVELIDSMLFPLSLVELSGKQGQVYWDLEGEKYEGIETIKSMLPQNNSNYFWTRSWGGGTYYASSISFRHYLDAIRTQADNRELTTRYARMCFCI